MSGYMPPACQVYTYILLHGYFCIDPRMCPVNMYFPGTYEGQYKHNHVIIYLIYDIIIK